MACNRGDKDDRRLVSLSARAERPDPEDSQAFIIGIETLACTGHRWLSLSRCQPLTSKFVGRIVSTSTVSAANPTVKVCLTTPHPRR